MVATRALIWLTSATASDAAVVPDESPVDIDSCINLEDLRVLAKRRIPIPANKRCPIQNTFNAHGMGSRTKNQLGG